MRHEIHEIQNLEKRPKMGQYSPNLLVHKDQRWPPNVCCKNGWTLESQLALAHNLEIYKDGIEIRCIFDGICFLLAKMNLSHHSCKPPVSLHMSIHPLPPWLVQKIIVLSTFGQCDRVILFDHFHWFPGWFFITCPFHQDIQLSSPFGVNAASVIYNAFKVPQLHPCLLYTSPSPRDA